jgi:hypothetical protein
MVGMLGGDKRVKERMGVVGWGLGRKGILEWANPIF